MAHEKDIVYFDLETQRSMNDVGGVYQDLGMSIGVTYSSRHGQYRIFGENQAEDLIEQLLQADLVVGYNHINFDYRVLERYTVLDLNSQVRSLDMLVEAEKTLGHRLPLEAFAQGSLGVGKIAKGVDAIKWWREGKVMEIAKYCASGGGRTG
jgi:DEAD/DEAH box helicase domain-containing protein